MAATDLQSDLQYAYVETPIGRLMIAGDASRLHLVSFLSGSRVHQPKPGWRQDASPFSEVFCQFEDYFAGKRRCFSLPLHLGGTAFQNAVWTDLQTIPFGQTITYRQLAMRVGRPAAIRAAGAANGANPFPIIVPCHRVIGSDGSLTGFGGGVDIKRFLLAHERQTATD